MPNEENEVKRIRQSLGLSQSKFAKRYGVNLSNLKNWEQGRREPDSVSLLYLRVIQREPAAVARAVQNINK